MGVSHFTSQSQAPGATCQLTEMTEVVLRKPGLHHCISSGLSDSDISACSFCCIYTRVYNCTIFRLDTMKVRFTGQQERIETESVCVGQVRCESAPSDTQCDPCDNECDSLWSPLSIAAT